MFSRLGNLLSQERPLERDEIAALEQWLAVLNEDVSLYGETPEDRERIARIEAKLGCGQKEAGEE